MAITGLPSILKGRKYPEGLQALFDKIDSQRDIVFSANKVPGWACHIDQSGTVHIEWNKGESINPSLAHELLHVDLQLSGYQRFIGLKTEHPLAHSILYAIGVFDNELQHHKFYSSYLAMGFSPAEFYQKQSRRIVPYVRAELAKVKNMDEYVFMGMYTSACSLGGVDKPEDMQKLRDEIVAKYPQHTGLAKHVDGCLATWRNTPEKNPRSVLTALLTFVPSKHPIGLGPIHSSAPDDSWLVLFAPS